MKGNLELTAIQLSRFILVILAKGPDVPQHGFYNGPTLLYLSLSLSLSDSVTVLGTPMDRMLKLQMH